MDVILGEWWQNSARIFVRPLPEFPHNIFLLPPLSLVLKWEPASPRTIGLCFHGKNNIYNLFSVSRDLIKARTWPDGASVVFVVKVHRWFSYWSADCLRNQHVILRIIVLKGLTILNVKSILDKLIMIHEGKERTYAPRFIVAIKR